MAIFLGARPRPATLFRRFGPWERHQLSPGNHCPNADNSAYETENPGKRTRCDTQSADRHMGFLVAKGCFGVSPFRHVVIPQAGNEQIWKTSQAAGTSSRDITKNPHRHVLRAEGIHERVATKQPTTQERISHPICLRSCCPSQSRPGTGNKKTKPPTREARRQPATETATNKEGPEGALL